MNDMLPYCLKSGYPETISDIPSRKLAVFRKKCIFAGGNTLKGDKTMAKPIEATPVLEGADALAFIAEMEKNEKASKEEKMRIKADANSFRAMFHYDLTQLL